MALPGFAEDMLTPEVVLRTPNCCRCSRDLDEVGGTKPRAFGAMKESNTNATVRALKIDICVQAALKSQSLDHTLHSPPLSTRYRTCTYICTWHNPAAFEN